MRKHFSTFMLCVLFIFFTACSQQSGGESRSDIATEASQISASVPEIQEKIISFGDKLLEEKIRHEIGKLEGGITLDEASAVTSLNLSNENFDDMNTKGGGIKDINALRYFTGLIELTLAFNNISDLNPLSGLTKLETLDISGTQVEDLSSLKDMKSIKCLISCWLQSENGPKGIGSLDALTGLKNLEMIDAKNAGITDVSALANLPRLWEVQLNDNEITDVTSLARVVNLKVLLLEGNPITDYSPLKNIYPQLEGKDFTIN